MVSIYDLEFLWGKYMAKLIFKWIRSISNKEYLKIRLNAGLYIWRVNKVNVQLNQLVYRC